MNSILRDAAYLISDPKRWTRGAFARDRNGSPLTRVKAKSAVCWCAVGAIYMSADGARDAEKIYYKISEPLSSLNDFRAESNVDMAFYLLFLAYAVGE